MLLDTSGLLCYHHRDELHHGDAVAFFHAVPYLLTHSYVLAEFSNVLIVALSLLPILLFSSWLYLSRLDFIKIRFDFWTAFCVSAKFGSYAARNMFP